MTDADLIAGSLIDPHVFAGLFDRHYRVIAAYLRRRLGASLADELAAETFLRAFDSRGRYDLTRPDALPWLFGIAANLLARHRRSEERQLRAFARAERSLERDSSLDGVDARLDAVAAWPLVADAVASLQSRDREVLLLYAWAELSYEEISYALQIPTGTVRSRLHRARLSVRRKLEHAAVAPASAVPGTGEDHEQRA